MTTLAHLSDDVLEQHIKRAYRGQTADRGRFKPNPRGSGYLTRNERWLEVIWHYEREFLRRCALRGSVQLTARVNRQEAQAERLIADLNDEIRWLEGRS